MPMPMLMLMMMMMMMMMPPLHRSLAWTRIAEQTLFAAVGPMASPPPAADTSAAPAEVPSPAARSCH
jgi:hypothetical protein